MSILAENKWRVNPAEVNNKRSNICVVDTKAIYRKHHETS